MPIEEKPTPASTVMSVEDRDALKLETALGHKQQMQRNFGLLSLTSLGIVVAK
jgi:choline transport protein